MFVVVVCALLTVIVARLVDVQVTSSHRYVRFDMSQLNHQIPVESERGDLVDRDGNLLATSIPQTTIYADPYQISDAAGEASQLSPILGKEVGTIQQELTRHAGFVYIARQVDDTTAHRVRALDLPGIGFLSEPKRFLPNGALALPVLGTVGIDGGGLSGLEYEYQPVLAGKPGEMIAQEGPGGSKIPGSTQLVQPSRPGQSLVLSLNTSIQYETEQALASEIVSSNSSSGMAIVLDSRTGDILAMANLVAGPTPGSSPVEAKTNMASTYLFEPGSVMKVTTLAGAIEQQVISADEKFSVADTMSIAGFTFHDADPHPVETMTPTDILSQSSNIGTITIAAKLGKIGIDHFMRAFGFGEPTGLGFPGSSAGILLPPSKWTGTDIGSAPIGQDSAVSELQLADAYNIIANDGVFVPPRLVDATRAGDATHVVPGPASHRVVSSATAEDLRSMLEQVVLNGTGIEAAVPGYSVAGKTGTAQIPNPSGPGYLTGEYMASFAGFVPAENPALTIVVTLNDPHPVIFGGSVAAPVFAQIARYALHLLNIPPPSAANGGSVELNGSAQSPGTATGPGPGSGASSPVPLSSDVTGG